MEGLTRVIRRDPAASAARRHDLVIVGGGIYGACLALEAARRGLQPLLLERGDFGSATSWNSLRILHGGLRYLQSLDLTRFMESVHERRWFCRTFPELVQVRSCLMPLHGDGLRRPLVFGAALLVNDLLSRRRNAGVEPDRWIGRGRLLDVAETVSRFPLVDRRGLRGAGLWDELFMPSPQRVLVEILRWACRLGAMALNYVEAVALVTHRGAAAGVEARDAIDGRTYTFSSQAVCNCAGPWSAEVATRFDRPGACMPPLSLAFNVLLDCRPPSASAVAVAPRRLDRRGPTYFLYPAFGRLLAGTAHVPWLGGADDPQPGEEQLERFLAELNDSIPGLQVRRSQIRQVFAGLLPAVRQGCATLAVRPVIWDHARDGGPRQLVSVSGVKFTTARLVAEQTLTRLGLRPGQVGVHESARRPPVAARFDVDDPGRVPFEPPALEAIRTIAREEAVVTVDDLLFRRTNWGLTSEDLSGLSAHVARALEEADDQPSGRARAPQTLTQGHG
jgi:glycerol-3-phosphate dehydrogenase